MKKQVLRNSQMLLITMHSYTVKALDAKDSEVQFKITKPHLKNLFKDLLAKVKRFKY